MRSIILIAPPAAGKGTQSDLISEKYGLVHISTGELLREKSLVDEKIKNELSAGNLIDDDIIFGLLKERLNKEDCKKGFILDGFPRTIIQAQKYDTLMKENNISSNVVIFLDVDKDLAYKRVMGRVTCPKCGNVYNEFLDEAKPLVLGKCDKCNENLIKRLDDNIDSFSNRFDIYYKNTVPLIKFYEEKGILHKIDSAIGKDGVFEVIQKILGDYND